MRPIYAYVEKNGICVTFAAAYSQLLTQVGIESTQVSGNDGLPSNRYLIGKYILTSAAETEISDRALQIVYTS